MNVNRLKYYILMLFLGVAIAFPFLSKGQTSVATANPWQNIIKVGEQTQLDLSVISQNGLPVTWPAIPDTLTKNIEVIEVGKIDTLLADTLGFSDGQILKQSIVITSFDSGLWTVPSIQFIVDNIPVETETFLIQVTTVDIDTTQSIKAIKPPIEVPMTLAEYIQKYGIYGIIFIGVIIILAVLAYLFGGKRKNPFVKPEVILPPHQIALDKLGQLTEKSLWQQGQHKQYHIELSDIIREYLENRFQIAALESTTDEINIAIRNLDFEKGLKEELIEGLKISDLAKFAKMEPLGSENEKCFATALKLVQTTKVMDEPNEESNPKEKEK